jgi:hypothetical protein
VGSLNQAPTFTGPFASIIPAVYGATTTYNLPAFTDPESDAVVVDVVSMPSFVTRRTQTQFEITPAQVADVGDFNFIIMLTDIEPRSYTYTFTIRVLDPPPLFVTKPAD